MTSFFPDVNSKQVIRVVEKLGFEFIRQSGSSHAVYRRNTDGRRTTIPIHGKKSLKRKTIKSICKDIGISIDELKELLK
jgi:predicted RNA binding protein YcfA (HicA-like mRNA interferase family)